MGGEGKSPLSKKSVGLDFDGTLLRDQGFYLLIKKMVELGIMPYIVLAHADRAYRRWKDREGSFTDFMHKQVAAYQENGRMKGISVSDLELAAKLVLEESGKRTHAFTEALVQAAQQVGRVRFIISGSPHELVSQFAAQKNVDACVGTQHPHESGFYTGGKPKEWVSDKLAALNQLVQELGLDMDDMVYVGDSLGDVPALSIVSHPICINPECRLTRLAAERGWPVVVEKKDMLHMYRERGDGRFEKLRLNDFLPADLVRPMQDILCRYFPHLTLSA